MNCNRCSDEGCSECTKIAPTPMYLSCPTCGENLTASKADDTLICITDHEFQLPDLLLAQSTRAATLIEAGCRLLEEQELLVRNISKFLWVNEAMAALKLESQADKLHETVDKLRAIVYQVNDPGQEDEKA